MLWLRVLRYGLFLNIRRWWHFRGSFALDVIASSTFALTSIAFWSILYSNVSAVPGWTLGQVFVLLAWIEMFFALERGLFIVSGKAWTLINNGTLDRFLVRPIDARLMITALTLRTENIFRAIPSIVLLFVLAQLNGATFDLATTFLGFLVVLIAAITYAAIQAVGSYTAFWIGRSRVIDELTDQAAMLAQYPITVFPRAIQLILVTILPFALAGSAPALITTSAVSTAVVFAIAISTSIAWITIQNIVWRKGIRRYDSYGG